jgi:hypothetical protein
MRCLPRSTLSDKQKAPSRDSSAGHVARRGNVTAQDHTFVAGPITGRSYSSGGALWPVLKMAGAAVVTDALLHCECKARDPGARIERARDVSFLRGHVLRLRCVLGYRLCAYVAAAESLSSDPLLSERQHKTSGKCSTIRKSLMCPRAELPT